MLFFPAKPVGAVLALENRSLVTAQTSTYSFDQLDNSRWYLAIAKGSPEGIEVGICEQYLDRP